MKYFLLLYVVCFLPLHNNAMYSEKLLPTNAESSLLYMPWRENYSTSLQQKTPPTTPIIPEKEQCVFCNIGKENKCDEKDYIVYRGKNIYAALATQPYVSVGIHLLIIPYEHTKHLNKLPLETIQELNCLTRKICAYYFSQSTEIHRGFNLGKKAGASIPDHLHQHIVIDMLLRCNNIIEAQKTTRPTIDLPLLFTEVQRVLTQKNSNPIINIITINQHNNCYYCSIFKQNDLTKNLIIYQDHSIIALLNHEPQRVGHISILPREHIESIAGISKKQYDKMEYLALQLYPAILQIVNTDDVNIVTTSYSPFTGTNHHIRLDIIPRQEEFIGSIDIISGKRAITTNINILYKKLLQQLNNPTKNMITSQ